MTPPTPCIARILLDAVGTGGGGLGDKIGENTDTEAGTVFGDLSVVKNQTEQNGTDIAEVKTVVDSNAGKLNALQTSVNNTKAVVDLVNTQTESVKQTGEQTAGKVDAARSEIAAVKAETAAILAQLNTLRGDVSYANTNIVTLLTQSKGVKRIHTETVTFPDNSYTVTRTIPSDMNPDRVVIICSETNATDTPLTWYRNGNTFTFNGGKSKEFSYQLIEFY